MYRSFKNKEDAELFAAWKEDILDQIESFDPPLGEMMTLRDAIEFKLTEMKKNECSQKTLSSISTCKRDFKEILDMSLKEITYNRLLNIGIELFKKPVRKGGAQDGKSGIEVIPSKETIISRFKFLSTIYSFAIKKGCDIENLPMKILAYFRDKM